MSFQVTKRLGLLVAALALPLAAQYELKRTGGSTVYAGSKLYIGVQAVWSQGATPSHLYFAAATSPVAMQIRYSCNYGQYPNCWKDQSGQVFQWAGKDQIVFEVQTTEAVGSYQLIVGTQAAAVMRTIAIPFSVLAIPTTQPIVSLGPIPTLDKWKSTMLTLAGKWCNPTQVFNFGWEGDVWYYDGARIYFQIADYTGDKAKWEPCAYNIAKQYRDFALSKNGAVPAWRLFPHGLEMAYRRTGDESYKQAVLLMASNALYAGRGGMVSDVYIRETAYLAQAFMAAERLGQPRHPNLPKAIDYILGYFDMLFVSGNFTIHQTFYDGLAAAALIEWHDLTKDPRIPAAIKTMLNWTFSKGWNGAQLVYNPEPAGPRCSAGCQSYYSDVINLVVPAFAWYFSVTKDLEVGRQGDEMFSHSLDRDISYSGKIFAQNYRWSFDFVRWRK